MRNWGRGNQQRGVYQYQDSEHSNRMGSCDWLPSDGDFCVCVEHSGDFFDDYVAMRKQTDGRYKKVGSFGAYSFGEICGVLPERDFHLLQAGEPISLPNMKE